MNLFNRSKPRSKSTAPADRFRFEQLEDRRLMAVVLGQSTFSPSQFGDNLEQTLDGNVVGYGYAVNQGGTVAVASGAGGLARTSADGPARWFNANTQTENASVSKTITATAVLKLLQDTTGDVDAALSTPLSDYLPSDWQPGPNIGGTTLRMLLTHRSGLMESSSNPIGVNFGSFGNNTWQNLKNLVEAGVSNPSWSPNDVFSESYWSYSYNNANFSILARVVIPKLLHPNSNYLEPVLGGYPLLDQVTGNIYKSYVQQQVLGPAGVNNADMDVDEADNTLAKAYDFPNPAGTNGASQADMTRIGGAFGWKLSAVELARFLDGLQNNSNILSPQTRAVMQEQELGIFESSSDFGNYYGHNGLSSNNGKKFRSRISAFPGEIEAALLYNSDDTMPESIGQILESSYENAWTDIVYEGDATSDTFEITLDTSGGRTVLELWEDSELVLSQWASTLDSLTINGLGGNDQFYVDRLPASLNLVINGNADDDSLFAGSATKRLEGVRGLTFNGGSGQDEATLHDESNLYTHALSHVYHMSSTGVTRVGALNPAQPQLPYPVSVNLTGVDDLHLHSGVRGDVVQVSSVPSGSTLHTGVGNDTVILTQQAANLEAVAGLTVDTGVGFDTLVFHDQSNPYSHAASRNYTVDDQQVQRFRAFPFLNNPNLASAAIPVIVAHDNAEVLNLQTGNQSDQIAISMSTPNGSGSPAALAVDGHAGPDQFIVSGTAFATMHLRGGDPDPTPGGTIILPGGIPFDTLTLVAAEGLVGSHSPNPAEPGSGDATIDDTIVKYWEIEQVNNQLPPLPFGDVIGDFNNDGAVNGNDLTDRKQGWRSRFGKSLNGGSFLAWQRNYSPKTLIKTAAGSEKIAAISADGGDGTQLAESSVASRVDAAAMNIYLSGTYGREASQHVEPNANDDMAIVSVAYPEGVAAKTTSVPIRDPQGSRTTADAPTATPTSDAGEDHDLALPLALAEFDSLGRFGV